MRPKPEKAQAQPARRILVVDDEAAIRYTLKTLFTREGYAVTLAESGAEALGLFKREPDAFPLVLTDYQMEDVDGLALLAGLKAIRPGVFVILITAHGSERIAVEAIKRGAFDYFAKPFRNDELILKADLAYAQIDRAAGRSAGTGGRDIRFGRLESDDETMHLVFDKVRRVARSEVTVLVTGESGTGKELVARAIHDHGPRAAGPFVALNCAAIPAELLENELFGHEKGAYTGANARSIGKFEAAAGGTLFLDEIGDMPMTTQAKVLRAIQEKTVERVGGSEPLRVDVRILAATHKDLNKLIAEGRFREDLYYRVNVVNIHLPPLRERPGDVPLLVATFVRELNARMGRAIEAFTPAALDLLAGYSWPGNVRQLQNTIERIMVLTEATRIDADEARLLAELPAAEGPEGAAAGPAAGGPAVGGPAVGGPELDRLLDLDYREAQKKVLQEFDKNYIVESLRRNKCNISKTAQKIGVHRTFLHDRIRELAIDIDLLKVECKNDPDLD